MTDEQNAGSLPLGTDGQPFCLCEHERQKHFGDRLNCHGIGCDCKKYDPLPVAEQPAPEPEGNGEEERAARLAAARTLLDEDRQQRQADCLAAIQAACDQYGMVLHIEPARLTLTPRD